MNEPERPRGRVGSEERRRPGAFASPGRTAGSARTWTSGTRTLARVRTTTAVTGIGAVLVAGGTLAGWLGHEASQKATTNPAPSSTSDPGYGVEPGRRAVRAGRLPDSGSGSGSGSPGMASPGGS